ncbi:MAG: tRNA 2-thiouridine(34) synthase MnmA [Desulfobaccales bacterium]
MDQREPRIAVALSGGVDSAVAAALLSQQGLRPRAVHLLLSDAGPPAAHLAALALMLNLPLTRVNLREEFARQVVDYFFSEYSRGRTPNPCVQCNAAIKFGSLWQLLQAQGLTRLATGHYARLLPAADGTLGLFRAADRSKDQSYFLSRLPRELLPNLLFPVGELTKTEVRRRYRELGLPVNEQCPESMELCFIPRGRYQDFIRARRGPGTPGEVVDLGGRLLGRHRGLEHYTVGQRRGLGIPAGEPYYVAAIHPESNRVVLGRRREILCRGLRAARVNWLIQPPGGELEAQAVIRHRHPGVAARIRPLGAAGVEVVFAAPQSAVAPGQAVVFYQDDRVLGGAWIEEPIR